MTEEADLAGDIMNTMIGIMIAIVAWTVMGELCRYDEPTLWITSPSGKATKNLPIKLALRIIRKRGWYATLVEPIKDKKPISRWEAFKILLIGDHGYA